jgi:hypothetical protein
MHDQTGIAKKIDRQRIKESEREKDRETERERCFKKEKERDKSYYKKTILQMERDHISDISQTPFKNRVSCYIFLVLLRSRFQFSKSKKLFLKNMKISTTFLKRI